MFGKAIDEKSLPVIVSILKELHLIYRAYHTVPGEVDTYFESY
jgi:hypothetical protein